MQGGQFRVYSLDVQSQHVLVPEHPPAARSRAGEGAWVVVYALHVQVQGASPNELLAAVSNSAGVLGLPAVCPCCCPCVCYLPIDIGTGGEATEHNTVRGAGRGRGSDRGRGSNRDRGRDSDRGGGRGDAGCSADCRQDPL